MLTVEEVKHLAKMAGLILSDDEVAKYKAQLSKVLEYVKMLDSVDTSSVEPTFQVTNTKNRFQSTKNYEKETLNQEDALKNANKTINGYIVAKSKLKENG